MMNKKQNKAAYAWLIFGMCTLIAFTLIGMCNNTRSLYLQPVAAGLGVSRTSYSVIIMGSSLISAAISLFIGPLRKRFSLRTLMLIGLFCVAAGNMLFACTARFFVFFIGELLVGFGMGCSAMTVISLIIHVWFANRLGTILGTIYMATGLGSVVFAPIIGKLIEMYSYQTAYGMQALIMGCVFFLAVFVMKEDPVSIGQEPIAFGKASEKREELQGMRLKQAIHTVTFWMMLLMGVLIGLGIQVIQGTYAAYIGTDMGYGTVFAAGIVSALYIVNTCVKIPLGFFIDRIGIRSVLLICSIAMMLSALMLLILGTKTPIIAYLFGVGLGVGNVLFTVPAPLVASSIFGNLDHTTLTGIFMACMSIGAAVGSPISNVIYQKYGTYRPVYSGMIILFLAVIVITFIFVRPIWNKKYNIY